VAPELTTVEMEDIKLREVTMTSSSNNSTDYNALNMTISRYS
ncbi:uncharacterized protein METZ01_LOCUS446929, partial [marine metagenome]